MSSEDSDDIVLPKDDEELHTRRDKYKVAKMLGKGGYGAVYEVIRVSDNEHFAIKCEKATAVKKVLLMDSNVMQGAKQISSKHFCQVLDRAHVRERFNFIVMKLIGKNLWDLRVDRQDARFTLNTALKSANQCLIAIEQLHRFGYLHRDIKPGNFAAGRKESHEHHIIFMLDFGLCREFIKRDENKDIRAMRASAPFRGTTRYAPLSAMLQKDQSRKDDIEGWLYMVVEWTSGGLPWRKLKATDREKVLQYKQDIRAKPDYLDDFFYNCPKREFKRIMDYIDTLDYYQVPDYKFVHFCVQHAEKANNCKETDPLDWDPDTPYNGPKETPGDGVPITYERLQKLDIDQTIEASKRKGSVGKQPKKGKKAQTPKDEEKDKK
ncbi:unnamed protein product [Caenorhabditis auriculariae]|uniref:Protein kinase domain-containing protein n=1 Tax=Caenorhabditis auriculariae TaxID=2777116 RepID=A0A8S1HDZ5_9PELO|nr:unnamed protein product [Caenorhabditis auriculariae]